LIGEVHGLKWKAFVALMIVVTGLFGGFPVGTVKAQAVTITETQITPSFPETQITTDTATQITARIYGDCIVWADK
jgi:hypothetical protein